MKKSMLALAFLTILSYFALQGSTEEGIMADMVLFNGRVFTVEKSMPWAEAVAVRDGKFIAVGADNEIKKLIGSDTQAIDLQGKLVLPGFNDAHLHFASGGLYLLGIDLRPARDEKEFAYILKEYIKKLPKGEWVTGGNWDHENWPSKKHPGKGLIDAITPDHPVLVRRLDGHMALANSLALNLAGINRDTPDPQGGEIVKDRKTGEPSGILRDNACDLVDAVIPPLSRARREQAIRTAMRHAQELGVTSIQDNSSREDLEIYQELLFKGELGLRVNAWRDSGCIGDFSRIGISAAFGGPFLRLGVIKIFVDGSMGAGTALFFEPYADDPATAGLPIYKKDELNALVLAVDKAGLQIAAHAIGDKANAWILDALAQARLVNGVRDSRHRVEHSQVVRPEDVSRFREMGVMASIQPSHCIDDMRWAENASVPGSATPTVSPPSAKAVSIWLSAPTGLWSLSIPGWESMPRSAVNCRQADRTGAGIRLKDFPWPTLLSTIPWARLTPNSRKRRKDPSPRGNGRTWRSWKRISSKFKKKTS
jgi:predicted amidohydrolase YtcJ